MVQRAATAPHLSAYNSNPHGFSGPPHLLRPVRCDRPKRLGVASSCYAACGRSNARSGQRPLWSTTWQAGVRGCSDFYPAADVSHGPGHQSPRFFASSVDARQYLRDRLETLGSGSQCHHPRLGRTAPRSAAGGPAGARARQRLTGYLIFVSLNATCLRAIGSYFLKDSFPVAVRGFFLVT